MAALGDAPNHVSPEEALDRYCTHDDRLRAFACAYAVHYNNLKEVEDYLRERHVKHPSIHFEQVHVSCDKQVSVGQKFLVAYAEDATFIAFRGSPTVEGSPMFGKDVDGILQLECASVFVEPELKNLIHQLRQSGKRIVFCGYQWGGALAHSVVLRFWKRENIDSPKAIEDPAHARSMISIAFGAPPICSRTVANDVNANGNFKKRFINFAHDKDRHADLYYELLGTGRPEAGHSGIMGSMGRMNAAVISQAKRPVNAIVELYSKNQVPTIVGYNRPDSTVQSESLMPISPNSDPKSPFHLIGETAMLPTRNNSSVNRGKNMVTPPFGSVEWSKLFAKYQSSIFIDGNHTGPYGCVQVCTPAPKVLNARLKVDDTRRRHIDIRGRNLLFLRVPVNINGLKPWQTTQREDNWLRILEPSDEVKPGLANESPERIHSDIFLIVVVTAFGETQCPLTEDYVEYGTDSGSVLRLLPKVVQTAIAMASPPIYHLPSTPVLNQLDSIIQRVPGLEKETLSIQLGKISGRDRLGENENLQDIISKMNTTVKKVTDFLSNGFVIEYPSTWRFYFYFAAGYMKVKFGIKSTPSASMPTILGAYHAKHSKGAPRASSDGESGEISTLSKSNVVEIGCDGAWGVTVVYLDKRKVMIASYLDLLKMALLETTELKQGNNLSDTYGDGEHMTEAKVESLLHDAVLDLDRNEENQRHDFDMDSSQFLLGEYVKKLHNKQIDYLLSSSGKKKLETHPFKSKQLDGAMLDTRKKLLNKIKIVVDTRLLYSTEVEDKKFVGIVGMEDAGKSTFIRKALHRCGRRDENKMPEIGIDIHTATVTPYKLNDSLWLVDFPGSNGVGVYADEWKQFTALPSYCVLLLDFKDDIKREQVEMYQTMKKDLGTEVIVVLNKVDEKFTKRNEKKYTEKHFVDLRLSIAKELVKDSARDRSRLETDAEREDELKAAQELEKNLHFASLDPDCSEARVDKMRKVGVVGFEELAGKLGLPKATVVEPQEPT